MLKKSLLLILVCLLAACDLTSPITPPPAPTATPRMPTPSPIEPSARVAAFYYPWYGTPKVDGQWHHWSQNGHTPPQDIGSDYYPVLGPYSSNDPEIVAQHMAWLREAGVGVIILSWWGQGSREDLPVSLILRMAARYGIKVTFHIEPYSKRTADSVVSDIKYLYQTYGADPAFFRSTDTSTYSPGPRPKGMFFIWCIRSPGTCGNTKVTADYWQKAMDAIHALPEGGLIIANITDASWITGGHFDGLYNYASLHLDRDGGFAWARTLPAGALYIPSVIPGFSAQRVGYASNTTVPRQDGKTFNDQWTAALGTGVQPDMVTITSFNEWHEGSMIEPAAPNANDGLGHDYATFGSLQPSGYLNLTRQWVDKFHHTGQAPSYHARIQIQTTSDWTTLNIVSGAQWLHPTRVSSSATATRAGFEAGDRFILTQALQDAQQGKLVEMTWDVELTGLAAGSLLAWQIDRGGIGQTRFTVFNYAGETPVLVSDVTWGDVTGGRNSQVVPLQADKLMAQ